ncbi:cell division protein FtsN [mine drainage metagenome]|uniref:Cell division protein FtsN n=1 Tax=mine drainage metagenome TaxID=410659 RepID=A0A1J5SFW5_9ZZZZ
MSRDYKPSPDRPKNAKKGSPFLTGLLIGFLLGVAASLSVVMFIKGGASPFVNHETTEKPVSERMIDKSKAAPEDTSALPTAENPKSDDSKSTATDDKTRFDFYNILPGSESKVTAEEEKKLKQTEPLTVVKKNYFLQIGAFQTAEEADNMKAKLALLGFEALVQTATIPDKGVWHRVRVGPLKDLDQINKTKSDLINNGFKADLIKVDSDNQ